MTQTLLQKYHARPVLASILLAQLVVLMATWSLMVFDWYRWTIFIPLFGWWVIFFGTTCYLSSLNGWRKQPESREFGNLMLFALPAGAVGMVWFIIITTGNG